MSLDNKTKLNYQLVKCIANDNLSVEQKLKKMDYVICLGADVDDLDKQGIWGLLNDCCDEEVVKFLKKRGVNDFSKNNKKLTKFFLDTLLMMSIYYHHNQNHLLQQI